jgi:hypothetical protein
LLLGWGDLNRMGSLWNNQTAALFIKKYSWDDNKAKNYNTMIRFISVVGLAVGISSLEKS